MCFSLTADSTLLTAFPIASTCKFVNRLMHNKNKCLSFIEEECPLVLLYKYTVK